MSDRPKGIPCPKCACCHHRTLDTRKGEMHLNGKLVGATRRKRCCRNCGHCFWTTELAKDQVLRIATHKDNPAD
jgi:transcriptional regulator NrdR family protein